VYPVRGRAGWRRLLRRGDDYRSGRPEDLSRRLIATHVPGKSFLDVGCMWRVDGAYSFHALGAGARAVTGIDVMAATPAFQEKNAASGNRVRLLEGDLNAPDLREWAGTHQVVFCSGVLYHAPNPLHTLAQLRLVCEELLILTTASVSERHESQAAIFLPHLGTAERRRLSFRSPGVGKLGLDTPFLPEKGYANWFWLPTPSCVRAMVRTVGFELLACHAFRHVTTIVARPAPA